MDILGSRSGDEMAFTVKSDDIDEDFKGIMNHYKENHKDALMSWIQSNIKTEGSNREEIDCWIKWK